MRVHLDVLGWLHTLAGAFGVITGASLIILALGTFFAESALGARAGAVASVAWTLTICGLIFALGGGLMIAAGRAVLARQPGGRLAALWLGVGNLCVIPFGTALGIYTFWTLLNDDARRAFGRRPRGPLDSD
jgi:hypothetical protein